LLASNGVSTADAHHLSGEFVSCFNFDRPSNALSTDTPILKGISNDYGFELLFSTSVIN
jgi:phosphoheptose isomerase